VKINSSDIRATDYVRAKDCISRGEKATKEALRQIKF